ncbi:LysR family transcriptional regulator [Dactylosporangium roseum]|uniref:LysR family transcriptional regulator n=1 Tax=Dactylosporangium roseum TaxID=47989 RepID=A0ABY5ZC51_9ACTN|nr:LysR family transcriptional regulator [Dactylosporangium roseum]UWZ39700.1 LysR family transcriptional regulator [Dactylosporangium roseum]
MELRTLRYLLAVERAGSVTAASRVVHVTQPSLSRQLRQLERDLGLILFTRDEGPLRLSAAGREFLPAARRLVAQADEALATAAAIAAGRMEHIIIAAPGTTLTDVVAPFLATLREDDPMPSVRAEIPTVVYGTLEHGADLAIGTTPPPSTLTGLALANLPVFAYVSRTHRWRHRRALPIEDLVGQRLLVQDREFHPRRALDQAMARASLAYGEVYEFDTAEVAQAVAASGKGVAVVSDDPRFGLHPLVLVGGDGPVQISLWAAWRIDHHGATTIERIAGRLREFCIDRYGEQARPAAPGRPPRST